MTEFIVDYLPKVRDQGNNGSCVAQAYAGAFESCYIYNFKERQVFSAMSIYGNRLDTGIIGVGMYVPDAGRAMINYGVAKEESFPGLYESKVAFETFKSLYTGSFKTELNSFRLSNIYAVNFDLDSEEHIKLIKHSIHNPDDFMLPTVNIKTYESFYQARVRPVLSNEIAEEDKATYDGGKHLALIVGYTEIDDENYWIVQNSWDDTWGDNGKCYMPWDYHGMEAIYINGYIQDEFSKKPRYVGETSYTTLEPIKWNTGLIDFKHNKEKISINKFKVKKPIKLNSLSVKFNELVGQQASNWEAYMWIDANDPDVGDKRAIWDKVLTVNNFGKDGYSTIDIGVELIPGIEYEIGAESTLPGDNSLVIGQGGMFFAETNKHLLDIPHDEKINFFLYDWNITELQKVSNKAEGLPNLRMNVDGEYLGVLSDGVINSQGSVADGDSIVDVINEDLPSKVSLLNSDVSTLTRTVEAIDIEVIQSELMTLKYNKADKLHNHENYEETLRKLEDTIKNLGGNIEGEGSNSLEVQTIPVTEVNNIKTTGFYFTVDEWGDNPLPDGIQYAYIVHITAAKDREYLQILYDTITKNQYIRFYIERKWGEWKKQSSDTSTFSKYVIPRVTDEFTDGELHIKEVLTPSITFREASLPEEATKVGDKFVVQDVESYVDITLNITKGKGLLSLDFQEVKGYYSYTIYYKDKDRYDSSWLNDVKSFTHEVSVGDRVAVSTGGDLVFEVKDFKPTSKKVLCLEGEDVGGDVSYDDTELKREISNMKNDLDYKADRSELPSKLSDLENDLEMGGNGGDVSSVNGKKGDVTLYGSDIMASLSWSESIDDALLTLYSGKANTKHNHQISDISGLEDKLKSIGGMGVQMLENGDPNEIEGTGVFFLLGAYNNVPKQGIYGYVIQFAINEDNAFGKEVMQILFDTESHKQYIRFYFNREWGDWVEQNTGGGESNPSVEGGSRTSTIVIANYDSHENSKRGADIVIQKGENAATKINGAIQSLNGTGGEVKLMEGKYNLEYGIILDVNNVHLTGIPNATILVQNSNWKENPFARSRKNVVDIWRLIAPQNLNASVSNLTVQSSGVSESHSFYATGKSLLYNCISLNSGQNGFQLNRSAIADRCISVNSSNNGFYCLNDTILRDSVSEGSGIANIKATQNSKVYNCTSKNSKGTGIEVEGVLFEGVIAYNTLFGDSLVDKSSDKGVVEYNIIKEV